MTSLIVPAEILNLFHTTLYGEQTPNHSMTVIPDKAILNFDHLTPAEMRVYAFYCKLREPETGLSRCTDVFVSAQISLSRNRVCEARNGLITKRWITWDGNQGVYPIFGFESVWSIKVESCVETGPVENSTEVFEQPPGLVENPTTNGETNEEIIMENPDQFQKLGITPPKEKDSRAILKNRKPIPVPPVVNLMLRPPFDRLAGNQLGESALQNMNADGRIRLKRRPGDPNINDGQTSENLEIAHPRPERNVPSESRSDHQDDADEQNA